MKRWRRIALIIIIALLTVALGVIGGLIWFQSSGRLTRYAQSLVQANRNPNVSLSFESVAFTSWNRVAISNVHLQQALPGWQLNVTCPRLEVRYTLKGVRNKQISSVHLLQPKVRLQTSETPVVPGDATTAIALPVERVHIRDASLRVDHGGASYTFNQIEIALRQLAAQQIGIEAQANFDDHTAQIHIQGDLSLNLIQPSGTFIVNLSEVDVPRLVQRQSEWMPADWTMTQGILNAESRVELQSQSVQGTLGIDLQHGHGDLAAVAVREAGLTTDWTLKADLSERTLTLEGPVHLQAGQVRQASSGLKGTQLDLQAPVTLTYAPGQWHVHAEPHLIGKDLQIKTADNSEIHLQQLSHTASFDVQSTEQGWSLKGDLALDAPTATIASTRLKRLRAKAPVTLVYTPQQWKSNLNLSLQSQTLSANSALQMQKLSSQLPLEIEVAPRRWHVQGTAAIKARRLYVGAGSPDAASLSFEGVQSRLPIRITSTGLSARKARLQAKATRWQFDPATPITAPLDLRTTVDLNLTRQQIQFKHLDLHLQDLGRVKGNGTWQWATGTAKNIHLSLVPTSLETLWSHVAARLPAPYPGWLAGGQTQIDFDAPRLTWGDGAPTQSLSLNWQLRDVTFSSPEGDYAGEDINGQVQVNVTLTSDWRPATVQASLALKPFALLIGSFFPELQQNGVTTDMTLNGSRDPQNGHFNLDINSRFGTLGQLGITGKLDPNQTPMQADVTYTLRRIDVARVWRTFIPETIRQTADPATVQGKLNARLRMRGALSEALLMQGDLNLSNAHLQAGPLGLKNLSTSPYAVSIHPTRSDQSADFRLRSAAH